MFGRRKSVDTLRAELEAVDALISVHPLASRRIRAARDMVDGTKSRGTEEVDQKLADDGLPSVEELGRAHVAGFWGWWKLHRRRRKLLRELERHERR